MKTYDEVMKQLNAAKPTGAEEHNKLVASLIADGVQPSRANQAMDNSIPNDRAGTATFAMAAEAPSRAVVSGYKLGAASIKELQGVDSRLQEMCRRAINICPQDFTVYDGLRTLKEQTRLVAEGKSKTMQSKHLEGLAVDLVPWVSGRPVWDWNRIYPIVCAVDAVATEMGIAHLIRWGGAWDRKLSDFGGEPAAYKRETELYASRHPGKDFLDGPHFEISGPKQ